MSQISITGLTKANLLNFLDRLKKKVGALVVRFKMKGGEK